jgi:hypothetical protein
VTKSKADQLRNERRLREEAEAPSTFFQMARAGLDLSLSGEGSPGGYVSGSEPFVRYPAAAPGYSGGPQPGLDPALVCRSTRWSRSGPPSRSSNPFS